MKDKVCSFFIFFSLFFSTYSWCNLFITLPKKGYFLIQGGLYWSNQGISQNMPIEDLVGDYFNVTQHQSENGLLGIAYYQPRFQVSQFSFDLGLQAFFLAKTRVSGSITQEDTFTNLNYRYSVTHYPIYGMAQYSIPSKPSSFSFLFDIGLGPNILITNNYINYPTNSFTLADPNFDGTTQVTLSATTGLRIRFNELFHGTLPVECGYRFFYLGNGYLTPTTEQFLRHLKTGASYGHAAICGVKI